MTNNKIKKDNQDELEIVVPKKAVFLAIEKGIADGKNKSPKRGWFIFGAIAITLFISVSIAFLANPAMADTIVEIFGGAKLEKVDPAEETEKAPEKVVEEKKIQYKFGIEPIKIDHRNQVTQEMLMKYWWAPVSDYPDENGEPTLLIRKYTNTETTIAWMDKTTGEEVLPEMAPDKGQDTIEYTLVGDVYQETIYLSSQTLHGSYQVSWVDDVLVFFPNDEYDHKEERKFMLQPVKIVE